MRLIDADALKNLPFHRLIHTDFGETAVSFEEIDNAPTIIWCNQTSEGLPLLDLRERPKGEWIIVTDKYGKNVKCPFCNKEIAGSDLNYCVKCGADMRGGAE